MQCVRYAKYSSGKRVTERKGKCRSCSVGEKPSFLLYLSKSMPSLFPALLLCMGKSLSLSCCHSSVCIGIAIVVVRAIVRRHSLIYKVRALNVESKDPLSKGGPSLDERKIG